MKSPIFNFKAKVYIYQSRAIYFMITLPRDVAQAIETLFGDLKGGWGSLPVIVTVGKTTWKTAIFSDQSEKSFIMLLKKEIRKKEGIKEGDEVFFGLTVCV